MDSAIRRRDTDARPLVEEIKRALEARDLTAFAELLAEDAVLEEISSLSPPTHPAVFRGKERILARLEQETLRDPVGGWSREVKRTEVIDAMETDDKVAFTEIRTYAAGDKVVAQHLAHKKNGRLVSDRMVVAWDQGT
jgi:ketosteroid isomerase-like protein